ncbi:MAG TPA: ribonuclease catalytic domain-containing protein [Burkholderiales bacterium]
MNVLYEEDGSFKAGTVLADGDTSLQIQAPHGKRAKIKARDVLIRFDEPSAGDVLVQAEQLASDVDLDFLWQCCGSDEFSFIGLARDYYGREPSALQSAAILLKLHSAPMYFYRKGRGRYRAAPPETLRAALAGIEKRKHREQQIAEWSERLAQGELPEEMTPMLDELLYRSDRNRPGTQALERASERTGASPAKLLQRAGALPPSDEYHLNCFLREHFPGGADFPGGLDPVEPADLPPADVNAFSLDDQSTTEIDDAFSLSETADGRLRIGIHIAAPGLGFVPGSPIDVAARARLSTVYMPGGKITMLPPAVIEKFTLAEGRARPALSLYLEVNRDTMAIENRHTRLDVVRIAANLRHQAVGSLDDAFAIGEIPERVPYARELHLLWQVAQALEASRGKSSAMPDRPDYVFRVDNGRVTIEQRRRGTPLDKLVAELMIAANSAWGKLLDDHGVAAIYRVQSGGRVRMTTSAEAHQALGTSHYAWSTSPLRRYVDLVNQWQLIALLRREAAPFGRNSDLMLSAVHDFEATYAAYDEFQRRMERYWSLRWLLQEQVRLAPAEVVRETLVKIDGMPLYAKVPSLPQLSPGVRIELEVRDVDVVDMALECRFVRVLEGTAAESAASS